MRLSALLRPVAAFTLAAVLMLAAAGCSSTQPGSVSGPGPRVLFIGNSLTYWQNLPSVLQIMFGAATEGPGQVEQIAFANFGLQDHWDGGFAQDVIRNGDWDIVVLQQGPSATEGRPSLLEYTERFAAEIRAAGARPALYMVWPSAARDFDFDGVSDSYRTAAENVDGLLFPGGEAWRAAWRVDPTLELYDIDGFHPSVIGSYLAALTMYEQITGLAPTTLPANISFDGIGTVSIDPDVLPILQAAAAEANAQFARP